MAVGLLVKCYALNVAQAGCPLSYNFYWGNDLIYNPFLTKNAGDTFTY